MKKIFNCITLRINKELKLLIRQLLLSKYYALIVRIVLGQLLNKYEHFIIRFYATKV